MKTHINEETERIRQKNRDAQYQAYENMKSAFNNKSENDGINAVLKFLNEKKRVNSKLSLAEQLKYIEEECYIRTRYTELDDDWYETAAVPMIVKTVDERWIVVIPNTDGSCAFIENGKAIRITAQNSERFTKSAMCFYRVMKSGKITERELIGFMLGCTAVKDRVLVLCMGVLTILAGMLMPWANRFIFSMVIPTGEPEGVIPTAVLIFSAVLVAAVLGLMQSLILTNSMLRTSAYIQSGIFSRLLSLKTEFFKNMKSGELSRMIMQFSDISRIVSVRSISVCISMTLSLLYLIQIYIYAPEMLGWVILVTVILGAMMITEGVLNSLWMRKYSASLSEMSGFCYELFSGIEQVKLNGAEARMVRRWSEHYLNASRNEDKPFFLRYADVFYKLLTVFSTAVIFIVGSRLSTANYIAFSAAYGAYIAASGGMSVIIQTISAFRALYSQLLPMLNGECEEYGEDKQKPEVLSGEISVSDLYFRYDKDTPYVLSGLSAHIRSGESVGIIGTSGCGKSTLIRLLLGFESANEGSIYIDGFDIRELNLKSYRQKIGAVLQNSGLILGDIYSNITITKPDATMAEVNDAIEMAGLSDDIAALPMGVHTPVSQENCTLSGGQRQRLLIARAIISKPSILIFDEATSALDNITQAQITESVNKLKCTKIIVAHRLSTIEHCDRILVMDRGVIVQEGTFDELKSTDGLLKQFIRRQKA